MGTLGIILCLVGVALATFSLAIDFESIKQAIAYGLPERESWRLGFGLMVTLVWLYLEILRLLAIVSSLRMAAAMSSRTSVRASVLDTMPNVPLNLMW